MSCSACHDKPKDKPCASCGKLPPVLEIKGEDCPILFHTVELEGTSTENPPYIGQYKNVLLVFKGDGTKYLFSSDGVPSALTGDIEFDSLIGRPKYAGEEMTSETDIPSVEEETATREAADAEISSALEEETARAEEAEASLSSSLSVETQARTEADSSIRASIAALSDQVGTTEDNLAQETQDREDADDNLQSQIDAITVASDVVDVVGTKAELDEYDTSALKPNDIIKVLQDENQEDATTYYRWSGSAFTYIGSEGPYYTKSETDNLVDGATTFATGESVDGLSISSGYPTFPVNDTTTIPTLKAVSWMPSGRAGNITTSGAYNGYPYIVSERYHYNGESSSYTMETLFGVAVAPNSGIALGRYGGSYAVLTPTAFTGTDGSTAGAMGMVPTPDATDTGKFLKSDGSWAEIDIPEVILYGTTGERTNGAMTQKATTEMVFPSWNGDASNIAIGKGMSLFNTASAQGTTLVGGVISTGNASGLDYQTLVGSYIAASRHGYATALGSRISFSASTTNRQYTVAVGYGASTTDTRDAEFSIGDVRKHLNLPAIETRYLTGVRAGELDHDAVNLAQLNERVKFGAGAPTTSTEGVLGSIYNDTETGTHYRLTSITGEGTDEDPYVHNWEVDGGSSVNVVQTTGDSEEDVMSQKATSQLVYPSGYETSKSRIVIGPERTTATGDGAIAIAPLTSSSFPTNAGVNGVAIGRYVTAGNSSVSIGYGSRATTSGVAIGIYAASTNYSASVAIGYGSQVGRANEVAVGSGSNAWIRTRYIANVTDPELAQDAATKNYVDTAIAGAATNTISSEDWSTLWQ